MCDLSDGAQYDLSPSVHAYDIKDEEPTVALGFYDGDAHDGRCWRVSLVAVGRVAIRGVSSLYGRHSTLR